MPHWWRLHPHPTTPWGYDAPNAQINISPAILIFLPRDSDLPHAKFHLHHFHTQCPSDLVFLYVSMSFWPVLARSALRSPSDASPNPDSHGPLPLDDLHPCTAAALEGS